MSTSKVHTCIKQIKNHKYHAFPFETKTNTSFSNTWYLVELGLWKDTKLSEPTCRCYGLISCTRKRPWYASFHTYSCSLSHLYKFINPCLIQTVILHKTTSKFLSLPLEADMGSKGSISMKLLLLLHLAILCSSQDFDFYYFVQQVRLPL